MALHIPGEPTVLHSTALQSEGLTRKILFCDRGSIEPSLAVVVVDVERGVIGGQIVSRRYAAILAEASVRVATGERGECGRVPIRNGPEIVVSVGIVRGRMGITLRCEWADGGALAPTILVDDDELDAFGRGVALLANWERP